MDRGPGGEGKMGIQWPNPIRQAEGDGQTGHGADGGGIGAVRKPKGNYGRVGGVSAEAGGGMVGPGPLTHQGNPEGGGYGFPPRVPPRGHPGVVDENTAGRAGGIGAGSRKARPGHRNGLAGGKTWLEPPETAAVFAAYGLPLVADYLAEDPDQAASIATAIGFPVALKIRAREITHKSDVAGVALNLGDADRVRQEAGAMIERVKAARPGARLQGFLLQPMVSRPGAIELLGGVGGDRGVRPNRGVREWGTGGGDGGGSSAQAAAAKCMAGGPAAGGTPGGELLQGECRGQPAENDAAIVEVILRRELVADGRQVRQELIIPPLVDAEHGVVVDAARLSVAADQGGGSTRVTVPHSQEEETTEGRLHGSSSRRRRSGRREEPRWYELAAHTSLKGLCAFAFFPG